MKKSVKLVVFFLIIVISTKAQRNVKYYFGNSAISQNLVVKWLGDNKVNFVYTIKAKNTKGKLVTTVYKGIAETETQGDIESDQDNIGDTYDIFEYRYKLKNCWIYFRIAEDKSKCKIKSGGCAKNVTVDSFDIMIKI